MRKLAAILVLIGVAFSVGVLVGPGLPDRITRHTSYRPASYNGGPAGAGASRDDEGTVEPPSPPALVRALGRVEPAGGLFPVGAPAGTRITRLLVSLGQEVEEGAELAFVEGRAERQAQIKLIEVQLAEADEQLKATEHDEALVECEAQLEREQILPFDGLETEAQRANIELLEQKLKNSEKDQRDLADLHRAGRTTVSQQELERQALLVLQDRVALVHTKAEFEKYKLGQDLRLRRVEIALQKGKSASTRTRLAVHQKTLEQQLELAKEQLKQTVVRAPRAGRVLRIQASPGEVTGPKPILQLGDTRRMYVVAEVDESQIPFVETGQEATIKGLDLRASTYTGKVESRALMVLKNDILGLDPAAAAYARVVEVKIKVDEPCDTLRDLTNTQVSVDIATQVPAGQGRAALAAPASSR